MLIYSGRTLKAGGCKSARSDRRIDRKARASNEAVQRLTPWQTRGWTPKPSGTWILCRGMTTTTRERERGHPLPSVEYICNFRRCIYFRAHSEFLNFCVCSTVTKVTRTHRSYDSTTVGIFSLLEFSQAAAEKVPGGP